MSQLQGVQQHYSHSAQPQIARPSQPQQQQASGGSAIEFYGEDHQNNRHGGHPALGKTPPSIQRDDAGVTMGHNKMKLLDDLLTAKVQPGASTETITMGRNKMKLLNDLLTAKVQPGASTESITMGRDKMKLLNDLLTAKVQPGASTETITMGRDKIKLLDDLLSGKVHATNDEATMGHNKMKILDDLLGGSVPR